MKIRKDGIYKSIDSKDFGIYQRMGFEKVIDESLKVEPKPEPIKEEPVAEIEEQPIKEVEQEEIVIPKSKKRK